MSDNSFFSTEKIHLVDARILSFSIGHGQDEYFTEEDLVSSEFEVNSEESVNPAQNLVRIILSILSHANVKDADSEKEIHIEGLGEFRIGFTFLIDNFEELILMAEKEGDPYQFDSLLLRHLLAMAYSTARGMILVKTTGTVLEKAILPIIDPGELMEEGETV